MKHLNLILVAVLLSGSVNLFGRGKGPRNNGQQAAAQEAQQPRQMTYSEWEKQQRLKRIGFELKLAKEARDKEEKKILKSAQIQQGNSRWGKSKEACDSGEWYWDRI